MTEGNGRQQKCPSCGAHAANLKNCEYCGSFLVQYAAAGIAGQSDEISSSDSFVFDGLLEALKFNIRMQALYPDSLPITDIIHLENNQSETYRLSDTVLQVTDNEIYSDKVNPVGIAIDIPLVPGNPATEKFIDSAFFPLFKTKRQAGYVDENPTFSERFYDNLGWHDVAESKYEDRVNSASSTMDCYLDFGKDVEGAARFISKLLIELYGYNKSTVFKYGTWDSEIGLFPNGGLRCEVEKSTAEEFDPKTIGTWIGVLVLLYFLYQLIF